MKYMKKHNDHIKLKNNTEKVKKQNNNFPIFMTFKSYCNHFKMSISKTIFFNLCIVNVVTIVTVKRINIFIKSKIMCIILSLISLNLAKV